jgi:hypothetical protein
MSHETPLLINPAERDPEEFIGFHEEIPYAINDSLLGKTTISVLRLDRPVLKEKQRKYLAQLLRIKEAITLIEKDVPTIENQNWLVGARSFVASAVEDSGEYAAMVRCAVAANFYIEIDKQKLTAD